MACRTRYCNSREILKRDLLPGGLLILIEPECEETSEEIDEEQPEDSKYKISLSKDDDVISEKNILSKAFIEATVLELIEPYLKDLLIKYDE